ncbi:MAG: L,D-transpeptidase family protein [Planctomycetota bacterium]
MARRRGHRKSYHQKYSRRYQRGIPVGRYVLTLTILAAFAWWLVPGAKEGPEEEVALAAAGNATMGEPVAKSLPPLRAKSNPSSHTEQTRKRVADRPEPSTVQPSVEAERIDRSPAQGNAKATKTSDQVAKGAAGDHVLSGDQAMARGDIISARAHYSRAVLDGIAGDSLERVRSELTKIGQESILSSRVMAQDPMVSRYRIKSGDTLGKIAKAHKISADLLASINGIKNVNKIRAGQEIKTIQGPFRAMVRKHDYSMDIFLGDAYVKHYQVGLGADDGTPTGVWKVGTKLKNPTYYPPRGGQMIAADDPTNPLGERWIALEGIEGDAVGATRYGIHGTIEPESIGKSMSLGCVRMYNRDVEELYSLLVENHSIVEIMD